METHFRPDKIFNKDQMQTKSLLIGRLFWKYLSKIHVIEGKSLDMLGLLINNISAEIFGYISGLETYMETTLIFEIKTHFLLDQF